MSKKYKGKICVYCTENTSTSGDHVFAREFFIKADRNNLPKVPACDACQGTKSRLEHYLTALLPFGARHSAARENLELLPSRLAYNQKHQQQLAANWGTAWSKEDGIYVLTRTLPVDPIRIDELFSLIVRGLVWFHWKTFLTSDHFIEVVALTDTGERLFDETLFKCNASSQVKCNIGNGTVHYEGKQGMHQPEITVWRISMYGGLKFGDPENPSDTSSKIGAMTGPKSVQRNVELIRRFGIGV